MKPGALQGPKEVESAACDGWAPVRAGLGGLGGRIMSAGPGAGWVAH